PDFIYAEGFYFSHTGYNYRQEAAIQQEILPLVPSLVDRNQYRIIHGHFAISWEKIEESIRSPQEKINLDGGCVYKHNEGLGYLCALDLNHWRLWKQKNRELD
ncbi:MAG: hypothetical protein AAFU64_16290, partial [Bacteroidota bacterium]